MIDNVQKAQEDLTKLNFSTLTDFKKILTKQLDQIKDVKKRNK